MAKSARADAPPVHLVVPGRIETRTGGYEYDRRIVAGLRALGRTVHVIEAEGAYPFPSAGDRTALARSLARLPDASIVVVDGLAFGAVPDEVEREAARLRFAALVHHPLALETGLAESSRAALDASERRALAAARAVIVTSGATADALRSYGVPPGRVRVVEPGTDPAPLARGSDGGTVRLLAVGSLVPRKGYDVLVDALASIAERNWRLVCVGSLDRDAGTVDRLKARVRAAGLEDLVTLAGEAAPEALHAHYDAADVFVLPTRHEGYGMAVAEALARGLPVISTPTGGIPGLIGEDAGILVPPGDAAALAAALSSVLADPALRGRFAEGARRARARLPTWPAAAAAFADALDWMAHERL